MTLHPIARRTRVLMLDRLFYMMAIRRLLARLRRTERIDLVHQMNPVFAGLSLGLIGCGLPIVLGTFVARWPGGEVTDEDKWRLVKSVSAAGRWVVTFAQQACASVLLVTTPAAMNRIATSGLRKKAVTLPHGIDTSLFCPLETPVGDDEAPTILFYAHLDRRKGVFVLVDAFVELLREVPSARLLLVGPGEHETELRRKIDASGHANQIAIRGPVPRSEAPVLLQQASVYCLPSFGEPYATTLLEAMACGCAVVVTNTGGLPHMVPREGGLRVPPGDVGALARALVELLRSPERRRLMGYVNRTHVERHHTWQRVIDRLEEIYFGIARRDEIVRRDVSQSTV